MANRIISQVVLTAAQMQALAAGINVIQTDGSGTIVPTNNPVNGKNAGYGPRPLLVNTGNYSAVQITLATQGQTGWTGGALNIYGVYPNLATPAGSTEDSYGNSPLTLTASFDLLIVNMSA